jgi:galactose-1-phosphate uridylyltransferase
MTDANETGRRLDPEKLAAITRIADIENASYADVEAVVRESEASGFRPNPEAAQDPRTQTWISYSEARLRRPLSREAAAADADAGWFPAEDGRPQTDCIVCNCRLTPAVDVRELCEGRTFITPNLFPMVYPFPAGRAAGGRGLHLLQWCSTAHDADLHNMCSHDMETIMKRLAVLERFLLHGGAEGFPDTGDGHRGFAAVMKNRGFKVGGSVEHGHQQIAHLAVMPRVIALERDYLQREAVSYASSLRKAAGPALTVAEFKGGVTALVSPFMRRPLEAVIVPPDGAGEYLHDLDDDCLIGMAEALRAMTGALSLLMELRKMTFDYNLAFHTGPIGLCYIEILPWTQPLGGFEHLGHFLCQEEPESAAHAYRDVLGFK